MVIIGCRSGEYGGWHISSNLKKNYADRFSTDDELKYETEEWLMDSQNYGIFTGIENSMIITKCALTNAVNILKNK